MARAKNSVGLLLVQRCRAANVRADLRVGVVVAEVEVFLPLTLNGALGVTVAQTDQHDRVTRTMDGLHVRLVHIGVLVVFVVVVDDILEKREDRFHGPSVQILRAKPHQAGNAASLVRLASSLIATFVLFSCDAGVAA